MKNCGGRFSRIKLTLATTVAVFLVAIALCQIFEWLGFPEQDQVQQVKALAGWTWKFAALVAWILVATPVIEETLFRLLLFKAPAKVLGFACPREGARVTMGGEGARVTMGGGGARVALVLMAVLSASAFSFCHYIDFNSIFAGHGFALLPISNAFVALAFVGAAWCWLYWRTRALWCSMLSHSLFNLINLVLALVL